MKTTIVYHQVKPGVDCSDGIAAAWVASKAYPDAIVQGVSYQSESVPEFGEVDRVVIVDFSFPRQTIEQWESNGAEIILLDHHKTALEHLGNLSGFSDRVTLKFDMDECGATLAWKFFFPDDPTPAFLGYVRDRDLWNFELRLSEEVHEAISNLKYNQKRYVSNHLPTDVFLLFDAIAVLNANQLVELMFPLGASLLAPKREKIAAIASRYEWRTLIMPEPEIFAGDFYIPVVELAKDGSEDRLVSDVCMKMYRDMPQAEFVACITSDGSWSLRSDKHGKNFDVSVVAKQFGGGGHRNASGFSMDKINN